MRSSNACLGGGGDRFTRGWQQWSCQQGANQWRYQPSGSSTEQWRQPQSCFDWWCPSQWGFPSSRRGSIRFQSWRGQRCSVHLARSQPWQPCSCVPAARPEARRGCRSFARSFAGWSPRASFGWNPSGGQRRTTTARRGRTSSTRNWWDEAAKHNPIRCCWGFEEGEHSGPYQRQDTRSATKFGFSAQIHQSALWCCSTSVV